MIGDQEALEAAVLATPEDDAPRLILADWCQEHGDYEYEEALRHHWAKEWIAGYVNMSRYGPVLPLRAAMDLNLRVQKTWQSPRAFLFTRGQMKLLHQSLARKGDE